MELIIWSLRAYCIVYSFIFFINAIADWKFGKEESIKPSDMMKSIELTLFIVSIYSWWL
jgi:hypothetical protein